MKTTMFDHMSSSEVVIENGQTIVSPLYIPRGLFQIIKGFVKEYSISTAGDEKIHHIFGSRDIFPLNTIIKSRIDTYFSSLGQTRLKVFDRKNIQVCLSNQKCSLELIKILFNQINLRDQRVDILEIGGAHSRIISYLIFLFDSFGAVRKKKLLIDIPMTHSDIANSLNLSRETVSREMEKLTKTGLVIYGKKCLEINNLDDLKNEFENSINRNS